MKIKKNLEKEIAVFIDEAKVNFKSVYNFKSFKKQIPNLITFSRILFLPFIIFFIFQNSLITAGVLAIIAVLTDMFDGFFARKFDAVTSFGAKLDSVSDKIFTIFILSALVFINYLIIIPIFLDVLIGFLNSYLVILGRNVKTIKIGRIKTLFLSILLCSLFFTNVGYLNYLINPLLIIVILLQTITLYCYFKKYYYC